MHRTEYLDAVVEDLVHDPEALLDDFSKVLHLELRDHPAGVRELADLLTAIKDCSSQRRAESSE